LVSTLTVAQYRGVWWWHAANGLFAPGRAYFGPALYAMGIAALPTTTIGVVLVALAAVIGLGRASAFVANVVTTVEIRERGLVNRGTASALMNLGGDVGSIAAPVLAGFVAQRVGIGPALQVIAVGVAGIGFLAVLSPHTPAPARPAGVDGAPTP
jgi:dipeptide/tripeptide permease